MPSLSMSSEILVSICCTAYNVERYINEAIDSFLNQKTSFRYEIIIGEDLSNDKTRDIIRDYIARYPELIQMVTSETNVGVLRNYNRIIDKAQGKYIAICDGDDYFNDPGKLQKQVDFLEGNPEYVICCHYSYLVDENSQIIYAAENLKPLTYTFSDISVGKKTETRNSTMMIRNDPSFRDFTHARWVLDCHSQDTFMKLFMTFSTGKKLYVLPELMGSYRKHAASISKKSVTILAPKYRNDFHLMVSNFAFSGDEKRLLLKRYFKRFFFYDFKKLRFMPSISTMKNLL